MAPASSSGLQLRRHLKRGLRMGGAFCRVLRSTLHSIVLLPVMFMAFTPSLAGATEPLSILTLLNQAPSYQLRVVTLRGAVKNMHATPPFYAMMHEAGCLIHGQATFVLEDETGSLPVEVFGSCSPESATALPKDGDRIIVSAVVHVSKGEVPARVWAQATELHIAPNAGK